MTCVYNDGQCMLVPDAFVLVLTPMMNEICTDIGRLSPVGCISTISNAIRTENDCIVVSVLWDLWKRSVAI